MNSTADEEKTLLSSIFSDETELFRTPAEPEAGDAVKIRLRIRRKTKAQIALLTGYPTSVKEMALVRSDDCFDWYETELQCGGASVFYSFLIVWKGKYIHYRRTGAALEDSLPFPDPARSFRILPGFHVPAWSRGAVQYQILAV